MIQLAPVIARAFPAHWDIARGWAKEMSVPLQFGPYPNDKLNYMSEDLVEFETPAQTEGLGTELGLTKGDLPIHGVAMLTPTPYEPLNLLLLSVRLPKELSDLAPIIIQQVEHDAQKGIK